MSEINYQHTYELIQQIPENTKTDKRFTTKLTNVLYGDNNMIIKFYICGNVDDYKEIVDEQIG